MLNDYQYGGSPIPRQVIKNRGQLHGSSTSILTHQRQSNRCRRRN
jgi:hypothetical protein